MSEGTVGEQRTIVEPELRYGGLGRRAVAVIADGIIVSVLLGAVGYAVAAATGGLTADGFSLQGGPAFAFVLVSLVVGFGYFILLEGRYGRTVGKSLLGLRVVNEDGSPMGMRASTVRNVLRVVDGLLFYLVGTIIAAVSDRRQRLGDRLADTVVVRA
jgi:uncharacterized RDD family membrane protein YckC